MDMIPRNLMRLFIDKQTYLNLVYLGLNAVLGFGYYLTFQVSLALVWGFIVPTLSIFPDLDLVSQLKLTSLILSGILILPILVWIPQLFVLPEQWLANRLLGANIALDRQLWSIHSPLLRPGRLFLAPSTWKRLLYILLKIPFGGISFFVIFLVLLPVIALFGMPLAYLLGFRDLIIGPWRFDTFGKALLALLAGILLAPLSFYGMNFLAKLSGWLAKSLLSVRKG